jgi:tetratricopeptide (TPR) repeat protein
VNARHLSALVLCLVARIAAAEPSDPAAARAQLQEGYALKQQGKCAEAIPLFAEAVRLDRQAKALINLADCEAQLGKLVAAQGHLVEARDLARAQGDPLKDVAEQRLQAVDKRLPKLVLKLAKQAPPNTTVSRDGVKLGAVSLGRPLPLDPGAHHVIARFSGRGERQYDVVLAEGETKELQVAPDSAASQSPLDTPVRTTPTPSPSTSTLDSEDRTSPRPPELTPPTIVTHDPAAPSSRAPLKVAGIVTGSAGAAAMVVGTILLAQGNAKVGRVNDTSKATDAADLNYSTLQNAGAGLLIGGGVAVAGGVVMYVLGTRAPAAESGGVSFNVGSGFGGVTWRGRF